MGKFKFKTPIFQDAELEVDDFTEEVNDEVLPDDDGLSDFVGDEDITQDEVVKSLQVIDGIADSVLEASGEENPDMSYEDVLDIIDETLESEELPDEITNAVLEVTIASDGTGDSAEASLELGGDESNIVYGEDDITDVFEEVPEAEITEDTEVVSALILSKTKNPQTCPIVSKFCRINSHWRDTNMYTRLAWDEAEKKVKAQLGHDPNTAKDWATVMAIAKNKYKSLQNQEEEAYTEAAFASVRRILHALKNSLKKIFESKTAQPVNSDAAAKVRNRIKSEADLEGATPPAPDTSSAGKDGTGGPDDEGILGSDPGNTDNGGDVEGGSDVVVLDEADYSFENGPEFQLELPSGEDKAKLNFTEVSAGVAVLKTPMKPIYNKYVGKVVTHNDGTATVFLRSGVFGLVAVNGKFIQGIRNSVYDAFVRLPKKNEAVNSSFKAITVPGKDKFVISSISSNRSLKQSKVIVDIVASLEQAYLNGIKKDNQFLNNRYHKVKTVNNQLSASLKQAKEKNTQVSSDYQAKLLEQQFVSEMQQQHEAIQSSISDSTHNMNKNIEFLTKHM